MADKRIKILYVDDNILDRELVRDALENEHGGFKLYEAASGAEFKKMFAAREYDLVLSDFHILGFEGLQVLDIVKAKDPRLPVILVTGTGSEEVAVEAMKRGAVDYVLKSPKHIQRLPQSIHAVLEHKQLADEREQIDESLRESEEKFRSVFESANVGKSITSPSGEISVNKAFADMLGYKQEELAHKTWQELTPKEDVATIEALLKPLLNGEEDSVRYEKRYVHKDGSYIWTDYSTVLRRDPDGQPEHFIHHCHQHIRAQTSAENNYRIGGKISLAL